MHKQEFEMLDKIRIENNQIVSDPEKLALVQAFMSRPTARQEAFETFFPSNLDIACMTSGQLYQNPVYRFGVMEFIKQIKAQATSDLDTTLMTRLHRFMLYWAKYGFNVYRIDENLLSVLLLTDPPDILLSEIEIPIPAVMILLPRGFIPTYSNLGQKCYIDTIQFIASNMIPSKEDCVRLGMEDANVIAANEIKTGRLEGFESQLVRHWAFVAGNMKDQEVLFSKKDGTGHYTAHHLGCERTSQLYTQDMAIENIYESDEKMAFKNISRILINLFMMMSSNVVTPQKVKKHYSLCEKRNVSRPVDFVFPHKPVRIELRNIAKEGCHRPSDRKNWEIKVRFLVKGHKRDQACGIKHRDHKEIWIEPFWKGPEAAKGYAHIYEISQAPSPEESPPSVNV